jgi:hypothetical protein
VSEEHLERDLLENVGVNRRAFVKRVVAGTAFAAPLVASFSMSGLAMADGVGNTPNQTNLGQGVSGAARSGAGGTIGEALGGSAQRGMPPGTSFH